MKTFELKKKSWHYWLANFGGERVYTHTDICAYIRYVMYGTFFLMLVAAFLATLSGATLFAIGNLFSWLFLGYQLHDITQVIFGILVGFSLMIAVMAAKAHYNVNVRDSEPGFVRLAYRSWKDKFCARIELK